MDNKTLDYYNKNADQFVQGTVDVDFSETQDRFVSSLSGKRVLDFGCGSGRALCDNGIIYTSFKYGTFEGERNGRYFTDFTIESFKEFLNETDGIRIEDYWITGDVRPGREEEKWLNLLLRKINS